LRIEIQDQGIAAVLPKGSGEVQGDGRFSNAPFLIDECDCAHGRFPTSDHVNT
jgi:hypothetical protein